MDRLGEMPQADFVEIDVVDPKLLDESSDRATAAVAISLITQTQADGRRLLALNFKDEGAIEVVDTRPNQQFIRIDLDVDITFRLAQDELAGYFDMEHGGITLKVVPGLDNYRDNYRRMPHSSGNPTRLVLRCKPRPNPHPTNPDVESHPFNIWLKFAQPDDRPDLPVRVDPDIKNPPPPPQK